MFLKYAKRMAKRTVKNSLGLRGSRKAMLISYALALLPANYVTTALTTSAHLTNPAQVMKVMQDKEALTSFSGVLNTATGGLMKPIWNGVLAAGGSGAELLGNLTGSQDIANTGKEWVSKSNEWFDAGKETTNNLTSKTNDAMNTVSSTFAPGGQKINYNWDASSSPDYYKVLGKAVTDEKTVNTASEFKYSDLDELGRTGIAEAMITLADVEKSAGTREKFEKGSDPSGWGHNPKVTVKMTNGKEYNGYAWNRSHLIADSLGGRAYRNNLVTGTRMQNVGANDSKGGMQYIERKVIDHLKKYNNARVWYRVTPIYEKNELVPRAVVVDVQSDLANLNERVLVYNVLPGYTIDYSTGKISQ